MRIGVLLVAIGALTACSAGKSWISSPGTCDNIEVRDEEFRKALQASDKQYCVILEMTLRGADGRRHRLEDAFDEFRRTEGKDTMRSIAARALRLLDGACDPESLAATATSIRTYAWSISDRNKGGVALRGDLATTGWVRLRRSPELREWIAHLTDRDVPELRADVDVQLFIELYGEALPSNNYVRMNIGVTLRWSDGKVIPIKDHADADFGELAMDAAIAHWDSVGLRVIK